MIISQQDASKATVFSRKLSAFNARRAGDPEYQEVFLVAVDDDQKELGGVLAFKDWNWLNIEVVFVEEESRGQGLGSALLKAAEGWGIENGCTRSLLDTFSFQSVSFYLRHGYEEFGRLANFPEGHERIFMSRWLT